MAAHEILIRGGIVLSMVDGDEPRLADVSIEADRIRAVAPHLRADDGPHGRDPDAGRPDVQVIDARGCVVMPGLVNAHMHTPMTFFRSTSDGVGFPGPDTPPTLPPEVDWRGRMTPDDFYWASRLAIVEMLRAGTTTFVDMFHDMERVGAAVVDTGMRAALGSEITTFRRSPSEWLPYDERTARRTFEACGQFASDWHGKAEGRVTALIAPHETSTCHEPWLTRAAKLAETMDLAMTMHVAESPREVEFCRASYGLTPIETLDRAGILDRRMIGAHTLTVSEKDLSLLAGRAYTAVACVGCSLKLAMAVTPVPRLQRAGINVALGTDSAATNNNLNLWDEIHLNATLHGFIAGDPSLVAPGAALRMATVGGATALGLEHQIGAIAPGMKADVIVLDVHQAHLTPNEGSLLGNLVFAAGGHEVRDVLVDGQILMRDGRITGFDEIETLGQADKIVRRHRAAVGLPARYHRP